MRAGCDWVTHGREISVAVRRKGLHVIAKIIDDICELISSACWWIIATRWGGSAIVSAAASGEEQHRRDRKHPQFVEESPLSQLRSGGSAAHRMLSFRETIPTASGAPP